MVKHAGSECCTYACGTVFTLSRAGGPSSECQVCSHLTPVNRVRMLKLWMGSHSEKTKQKTVSDAFLSSLPVTLKRNSNLRGDYSGGVLSQHQSQQLYLCASARVADLNVLHQMTRLLFLCPFITT